jgi:WD40 repeat protein
VLLWNAVTGKLKQVLDVPFSENACGDKHACFSPNGKRIAVGAYKDGSVTIWDFEW